MYLVGGNYNDILCTNSPLLLFVKHTMHLLYVHFKFTCSNKISIFKSVTCMSDIVYGIKGLDKFDQVCVNVTSI